MKLITRKAILISMLCLFLSWGLSGGQIPAGNEQNVRDLYDAAQKAQSRGDFEGAARDYRGILKLWPNAPEIEANLGIMEHLLGRYGEAIQNFKQSLRGNPHLLSANLFLGVDLLKVHRPQEALPYLTEAFRLSPRNLQAGLNLGQAFADLGKPGEANEYYFRAAAIDPHDEAALYGLGITYLSLQKSAVEKLAQAGKGSIYARLLLASSLSDEGRPNDSVRVFKTLVNSFPSHPEIRAALGSDEAEQGHYKEAETEFKTALRMHPGYLPARLGLARVALGQGNTKAAGKILESVWQTDAGFSKANFRALVQATDSEESAQLRSALATLTDGLPASSLRDFLRGLLASSSEEPPAFRVATSLGGTVSSADQAGGGGAAQAQSVFAAGHYTSCAESLQDQPKPLHRASLLLLAKCSYYAGGYRASFVAAGKLMRQNPAALEALYWRAKSSKELALISLSSLASAHPDSYRIHLLLGQANLDRNRYKQAESEYAAVLKAKPDNLAAQIGYATACWKNMQFESAIPHLKAALAENPGDTGANYIYGEILVEQRRFSQARPYLAVAARGAGRRSLMARALLSKVDASEGKTAQAIAELKQSLSADTDGSLHFQLYQLYQKQGNRRAAQAALVESQAIRARNDQSAQ